jgi:hypothetical protein
MKNQLEINTFEDLYSLGISETLTPKQYTEVVSVCYQMFFEDTLYTNTTDIANRLKEILNQYPKGQEKPIFPDWNIDVES